MGDLASRIEISKLAKLLGTGEDGLAFLRDRTPAQLRDLRGAVSDALAARHEERVTRLAGLSRLLPVPLTAKIAQLALGPLLSARVAGALDPREAARLAGHFDADFLADLAVALEPQRVRPILSALPDDLLVDVGRRLLARGEHLVLGRFIPVIDEGLAMQVVASASPTDLLQVALYTEEPVALDAIVRGLPDPVLGEIIVAAGEADAYDAAVLVLDALSAESRARLVARSEVVDPAARGALVHAVDEHDMWSTVLPSLGGLPQATLQSLVNVPATLDVAIVDRVVEHAQRLGEASTAVRLVLALDDAHLQVLRDSARLEDPAVQEWLLSDAPAGSKLVEAALRQLDLR